jgi:glycosyltransferase involved in cell wall biosynthesis
MTPAVSIVVPTFNRAHVLGRALGSIARQSFSDYEVIVVDDGSTDRTDEALAGAASMFPRLQVIRVDRNRGAAHARNVGVSAAIGTFVAFLDADDEWLPEKLSVQLAAFAAAPPEVGIITTRYRLTYPSGVRQDKPADPMEGSLSESMREFVSGQREIVGVFSTLMFRRDIFRAVGGLDPALACWEDADFFLRVAECTEFGFIPNVLTIKHDTADSISASWWREAAGVSRFWQKHSKRLGGYLPFRRYVAWHQHSVGVAACLAGDMRQGRRLFRESIRIWPGYVQPFVHLVLTAAGSRRYQAVLSRRRRSPVDQAVSVSP